MRAIKTSERNDQGESFADLKILIAITNTSTGDTYVTISLLNYVQMGQSNVSDCRHQVAQSYPPFERALSWQITSVSHHNVT